MIRIKIIKNGIQTLGAQFKTCEELTAQKSWLKPAPTKNISQRKTNLKKGANDSCN
jgi:hypothetical protein